MYHPFSLSPYIRVAFIIATVYSYYFVMYYYHHTLHSPPIISRVVYFVYMGDSLHIGEFFPPILFLVVVYSRLTGPHVIENGGLNAGG